MFKSKKKRHHYVDNRKFYDEIVLHKQRCKESEENGKETPRLSEYIGSCIYLMAESLSTKPTYINYSFRSEMVSDAIENCFLYFHNFDPEKTKNPFAYFTRVIYNAFHRRIYKEERQRYIMYKSFQDSCTGYDENLMVDEDDKAVAVPFMYDNINEFIRNFEEREERKKLKRKQMKKNLENFMEKKNE